MKLWRIKHIKTGLYYTPKRGSYSTETNLHKSGKIYTKKPTLEHISHGYRFKGQFIPTDRPGYESVSEVWVIEEVKQ